MRNYLNFKLISFIKKKQRNYSLYILTIETKLMQLTTFNHKISDFIRNSKIISRLILTFGSRIKSANKIRNLPWSRLYNVSTFLPSRISDILMNSEINLRT